MSHNENLYSLSEAARLLNENRNLVTYLVADREIPCRIVGKAKALDQSGFNRLEKELKAYRKKSRRRRLIAATSSK